MALRTHSIYSCEYASLCLINVVASGPYGQPLFKLIAENEIVFTALTGPVFEGVVKAYICYASYRGLDKVMMEMLKSPCIAMEEGRRGFVRQMVQANIRSTGASILGGGKEDAGAGDLGPGGCVDSCGDGGQVEGEAECSRLVVIEGAGHLVTYDEEGTLGVELGWWLSHVCHT